MTGDKAVIEAGLELPLAGLRDLCRRHELVALTAKVSIGRRSKSPFKPLSFRIISLADLSNAPSDCAVVGEDMTTG